MSNHPDLNTNLIRPEVFQQIQAENVKSQLKHGVHAMINTTDRRERLAILVEEVGEVATALNYDGGGKGDPLPKELIQVATMAAAWAHLELQGELNKDAG